MLRRCLYLSSLVLGTIFFAEIALAEDDVPAPESSENIKADSPTSAEAKDDYDFSWLDPDKKIYVVQNRKYSKANRLEFGINGGIGFGEPYRQTYVFMPRLSYYFSERWGLSVMGAFASSSENNNFQALKSVTTVIPSVRDTPSWYGASVLWVPFYAKINIFNTVLYVDWQFELGLANANSEMDLNFSSTGSPNVVKASYMGAYWGTGQKFFLTRDWAVRFDFVGMYYNAPTAVSGVETGSNETKDNYYFTLGASYTF